MDSVEWDQESLKGFSVHDISGIALVDKNPGHHEVFNDVGDDYEVVLVDGVDAFEVPIHESDRRETSR